MRILYAGTPDIAVPTLRALASSFSVGGVLTAPDKPGRRGRDLVPSAVKSEALALGLPVLQFDHLKKEAREAVAALGCDTLVCFAYGRFFGPKFLSLFPHAALNIHPSLLPSLRGPSPIQSAILSLCRETGISIQRISPEMDAGEIASSLPIALDGTETTLSLTARVSRLAATLAVETLSRPLSFTPQSGEPTFCKLIGREDGRVDWTRSAREISAQVRGLYPWPKAETLYRGQPLFLCSVNSDLSSRVAPGTAPGAVVGKDGKKGIGIATGEGVLWVDRLQKAGKREMDASSFVNGDRAILTTRLGV